MKLKCRNCGHQSDKERCPVCKRLMPQRWFVIVGHKYDSGESISERIMSNTVERAKEIFREFHGQTNEQEGEGHVFIDYAWDCGQDQPKLV